LVTIFLLSLITPFPATFLPLEPVDYDVAHSGLRRPHCSRRSPQSTFSPFALILPFWIYYGNYIISLLVLLYISCIFMPDFF